MKKSFVKLLSRLLLWLKILEAFWRFYLNILFLNIPVNVNFFSDVNVNFFSDLKFECYCEYYTEILLQVSLK